MKRILVPTDFSEQSFDAVSSAASLVRKFETELTLLHVVSEPEDPELHDENLKRLFSLPELQLVAHKYKQVFGKPVEAILKEETDLIVMGSKGDKGFHSFFIGSNAEQVAKHASCPVIVLKGEADLSAIKHIVFPTNMRREDEDILEDLKELQKLYGATLHIVKAYDDNLVKQSEVEKRLRNFAEFHRIENFTVAGRTGIDESDVIIAYAEEIKADMIAMVTHDRQGIGKLFGGVISGEVINHNARPLWTKALHSEF